MRRKNGPAASMIAAVALAVVSAALFGAATPASKLLLDSLTPFQLAGFLYLGAALGAVPSAWRAGRLRLPARRDRVNLLRLTGAIVAGGICAPVLLLLSLRFSDAASVSLWLNFELAATALLGVLVFREHLGIRSWGGVVAVVAGGAILSLHQGRTGLEAAFLVLLACVCWGLDNHLTALIDGITPGQSTFWKGLIAGTVNLLIGTSLAPVSAGPVAVFSALLVGILAYGASIVLYIRSAQVMGATRAQIVFACAPFFGAMLSVAILGESVGGAHLVAGILFISGIVLFMLERHSHVHTHLELEHEHSHRHDDGHHLHPHQDLPRGTMHTHRHRHERMTHAHPHWPDLHHRHDHH